MPQAQFSDCHTVHQYQYKMPPVLRACMSQITGIRSKRLLMARLDGRFWTTRLQNKVSSIGLFVGHLSGEEE
jgi:hypothetical protein